MAKRKNQKLHEKLSFDENMKLYRCEYRLDASLIGISINCEGCETDLPMLADKTEALLREWPTLQERILKAARKELVSLKRLKRGQESKVTLASLVPFSLYVNHEPDPNEQPYFSFGINIPDLLREHEHLEYGSNFENEFESTEIVHLM